jgi:DNA-binding PadR family transcriptional regulator
LDAEWGISDNNRQVKCYRLTRRGREHLQRETSNWTEFATAVFKVLQTT